jgi:5-methylcytosine-specific restriction protein A
MMKLFEYVASFFKTPDVDALGVPRSGRWPNVRKQHLIAKPTCAACGCDRNLQVHHCVPFHLDEEKELDPNNLITLCEEHNCHLIFGHLYNWHSYNINVREDAAAMLKKVQERP